MGRHPLSQKADQLGYDMDTLRNPPKGLKIPDDLRQWGERHKRFRKLCVEVFLLRDVDKRYRDFMRRSVRIAIHLLEEDVDVIADSPRVTRASALGGQSLRA
ncbi:hypothetical protein WJX75_003785 [Coccomyxa subellipsoidea]|uniref:Uncharacterized protein n=1 Tax=Coccomyxa subellipsoidea TaxID=248742 RepID=A0ABR2YRG1_9CHLO